MESFSDFQEHKKNKKLKILVIDLLYLGDLIFAVPFFKNLKENFSEAEISLVMNSSFRGIFKNSPFLDNIYYYDKNWNLKKSIKFGWELRENKFDLGLNIHGNWRTTLLMKIINPQVIWGYEENGKNLLMDKTIKTTSSHLKRRHMVQVYLNFLEEMGLTIFEKSTRITQDPEARESIKKFLKEKGINDKKFIVLNSGGSWPTKRWPAAHFAKLGDLIQKKLNYRIIFTGGEKDRKRVQKIRKMMAKPGIDSSGKTSLPQLVSLLAAADAVISGDTGPVHTAAAVGTPTLALFGPSEEKKYRPQGKDKNHQIIKTNIDCRPCGKHQCPRSHHKCMKNIKPQQVFKELKKLIDF